MASSVMEEVRLTAFKSIHDAVLPLDELTLLVGATAAASRTRWTGCGRSLGWPAATMYATRSTVPRGTGRQRAEGTGRGP